jgi:hypothetical protein
VLPRAAQPYRSISTRPTCGMLREPNRHQNDTPNVFFDKASLQRYLAPIPHERRCRAARDIARADSPSARWTPTQSPYSADILFVRRPGNSRTRSTEWISWASCRWVRRRRRSRPTRGRAMTLPYASGRSGEPHDSGKQGVTDGVVRRARRAATKLVESARGRAVPRCNWPDCRRLRSNRCVVDGAAPGTRASVAAEAQNLLDHRHPEFPGGAVLGRIVLLRTHAWSSEVAILESCNVIAGPS